MKLATSQISFLRQRCTFFSHKILSEIILSLMWQSSWIRLWTVTISFCTMSRLAKWFLLRTISKRRSLFYLCTYSEKLENHLQCGLFCKSCEITDFSLLKVKSSKSAFLEIWRCSLQHWKIKKLSRRYEGKPAFQTITIEFYKRGKTKQNKRRTPKITLSSIRAYGCQKWW